MTWNHGIMEHLAFFFAHLVSFMIPEVVVSWADFLHQELNKPIEHSRLLQLAEGLYRRRVSKMDFCGACRSIFFLLNSIDPTVRRHIGVLSSSYVQQAAWFKLLCPGAKLGVWRRYAQNGWGPRKSKASAALLLFRRRRLFGTFDRATESINLDFG